MPRSQQLLAGRRSLCLVVATFALTFGHVTRAEEALTLKERLSDKASDEQRIDNCRVPPDRRGVRPRPGCAATTPTQSADQSRR
jgi:hypothetical protein